MSPGSYLSIFASQDPRQDPRLRIHVSASSYLRILCKIHVSASCPSIQVLPSMVKSGSSARSMLPDPSLSSHMYLRVLFKIHIFAFMSQHLCISCLLCKIHISGYIAQHLFTSQDPLQDPVLRIHVSNSCLNIHQNGSAAKYMFRDSCLSIHIYLRKFCKIHISDSYLRIFISQISARSM